MNADFLTEGNKENEEGVNYFRENLALGRGNNSLHAAHLIAHLDSHGRARIQPTVRIHGHAGSAAFGISVRVIALPFLAALSR